MVTELQSRVSVSMPLLILLPNCIMWSAEVYLRKSRFTDSFYDYARQGAYAQLIDIGHYVIHNAPKNAVIAVNWPPPSSRPPDATFAPDRRIIQFLTDREVRFIDPTIYKASADSISQFDKGIESPDDKVGLEAFFRVTQEEWAVVYFSKYPWPAYHFPIPVDPEHAARNRYWGLYHRDSAAGNFRLMAVPPERLYLQAIPGLSRHSKD